MDNRENQYEFIYKKVNDFDKACVLSYIIGYISMKEETNKPITPTEILDVIYNRLGNFVKKETV